MQVDLGSEIFTVAKKAPVEVISFFEMMRKLKEEGFTDDDMVKDFIDHPDPENTKQDRVKLDVHFAREISTSLPRVCHHFDSLPGEES